jgi:hypothetical protein
MDGLEKSPDKINLTLSTQNNKILMEVEKPSASTDLSHSQTKTSIIQLNTNSLSDNIASNNMNANNSISNTKKHPNSIFVVPPMQQLQGSFNESAKLLNSFSSTPTKSFTPIANTNASSISSSATNKLTIIPLSNVGSSGGITSMKVISNESSPSKLISTKPTLISSPLSKISNPAIASGAKKLIINATSLGNSASPTKSVVSLGDTSNISKQIFTITTPQQNQISSSNSSPGSKIQYVKIVSTTPGTASTTTSVQTATTNPLKLTTISLNSPMITMQSKSSPVLTSIQKQNATNTLSSQSQSESYNAITPGLQSTGSVLFEAINNNGEMPSSTGSIATTTSLNANNSIKLQTYQLTTTSQQSKSNGPSQQLTQVKPTTLVSKMQSKTNTIAQPFSKTIINSTNILGSAPGGSLNQPSTILDRTNNYKVLTQQLPTNTTKIASNSPQHQQLNFKSYSSTTNNLQQILVSKPNSAATSNEEVALDRRRQIITTVKNDLNNLILNNRSNGVPLITPVASTGHSSLKTNLSNTLTNLNTSAISNNFQGVSPVKSTMNVNLTETNKIMVK